MVGIIKGKYIKKIITASLMVLVLLSTVGCSSINLQFKRGIEGKISGERWIAKDGSEMKLDDDKDFNWYQKENEYSDNYYSGTYEIYAGDNAREYLRNNLENSGMTEDRIDNCISEGNEYGYTEEGFIILNLNNEECIVGGENKMDDSIQTLFIGFYLESEEGERLEVINLNSFTTSTFTKK